MREDKPGRPTVKQEDNSLNGLAHDRARSMVEATQFYKWPCQQLLLTSRYPSGGRHHQRDTHCGWPREGRPKWWFVQRS